MFIVTCPHCSRDLRVSREVAKAKMKCRYCGAIFVGSTHAAVEAPAPPPVESPTVTVSGMKASPEPSDAHAAAELTEAPAVEPRRPHDHPAHHGHHPVHRKGLPPAAWGAIVAVCLIAAGIGVVVMIAKLRDRSQANPPASSTPVGPARTTLEPSASTQQPATDPQAPLDLEAEAAKGWQQRAEMPINEPTSEPVSEPVSAEVISIGEAFDAPPASPEVTIIDHRVLKASGDQIRAVVGQFKNPNDFALARVRIEVMLTSDDGSQLPLQSTWYEMIPPGATFAFSAAPPRTLSGGLSVGPIRAEAIRAEDDIIVWMVPSTRRNVTDDGQIRVRGESENPHDFTVRDLQVFSDFFNNDGTYAGSAKGKIRQSLTLLGPGTRVNFEVFFEPEFVADVIGSDVTRIVCKTPN